MRKWIKLCEMKLIIGKYKLDIKQSSRWGCGPCGCNPANDAQDGTLMRVSSSSKKWLMEQAEICRAQLYGLNQLTSHLIDLATNKPC